MATAAQELGNPFLDVRGRFVAEMTTNCGGTLCVTVESAPREADNTCGYAGSDPPWRDGGFTIPRGSTVVLLADCGTATGGSGGAEEPETETGTETGGESDGADVPGDEGADPGREGGGAEETGGAP
ncbi:hypothetical protein [Cellulosimicrobium protaetiae]|uniref:Uncharacterized protein n=1 Tax=Cellulosimicrobium protaetiae TaxID=2587808 RepID=A0A6M5UEJ5_9MICO|nr:hypothetical protein [Cellulosimicrobium protaetiae]QJW36610.1 hypothetical protein FIC82_010810 [Cellulosimicrobium protaetiae]